MARWANGNYGGLPHFSTGLTYVEETPEITRKKKKDYIKSIIGDDKYLLQEIVAELIKDKLKQLKENA